VSDFGKFARKYYFVCPQCKKGKLDLRGRYRECSKCKQVFETDRMRPVCVVTNCTNQTAALVQTEGRLWESRCHDHLGQGAVMIREFPRKKKYTKSPPKWTRVVPEKQARAIENFELHVPPSKQSASRLIFFLKHGNGTGGRNLAERVAIAKSYENNWLGKRVRYKKFPAQQGVVRSLCARSIDEVAMAVRDSRESNMSERRLPFTANVRWDNNTSSPTVALSFLELIKEEERENSEKS